MTQQQREVRTVPWWHFPGWQMAGAGMLHGLFGYGFWLYGWSVYVPVLMNTFGWGRLVMGLAGTITKMDAGVESIFTGYALDKWGPRATASFGFLYCSLGYFALTQLGNAEAAWGNTVAMWIMLIGYALVIRNSMGVALYVTSMPSINRWFVRRRANAMGIISIGAGIGGTLLVPLTAWMMGQWGYVGTSYAMIAVNMLILLPLGLLFRPHPPEHYGFLPDNVTTEVAQTQTRLARSVESSVKFKDYTLGEAMRTRAFWLYAVASGFGQYGSESLRLFQNARLQAIGYTRQTAANFYGFQFLMTLVGRVSIAIGGELVDAYHLMWGSYLLQGVGLYFFATAAGDLHLWAWAVIYGIPYGVMAAAGSIWRGSYFGRAHIGKVYGWITGLAGTAAVPAPVLMGWFMDLWGYENAFLIGTALTLVSVVCYALATRPREQPSPAAIKRAAKEAEEAFRRT